MRAPGLLLLVLLVLPGGTLRAQRLAPSTFPTAEAQPRERMLNGTSPVVPKSPGFLAMGGVVGGAVGLFAGALVGARITEDDCEDCALVGGVYGAVAGGSAGLALGVHLANGGRGPFLPTLAASLAIGGAGLGLAVLADAPEVMIPVPVAQLVATILIERSGGTARELTTRRTASTLGIQLS
jgi:hypothetical protein